MQEQANPVATIHDLVLAVREHFRSCGPDPYSSQGRVRQQGLQVRAAHEPQWDKWIH